MVSSITKLSMLALLLLCSIVNNVNCYAADASMTARLYWGEDVRKTSIIPGDVFQTTLQIMNPSESAKTYDYKKLIGQNFADHFYVVNAVDSRQNENNADVWQVQLTLILKHYFPSDAPLIAAYGTVNFPLSLAGAQIENIQETEAEFYIADQKFSRVWSVFPLIALSLLLLAIAILGIWLAKKKYAKKKARLAEKKKRDDWLEKIAQASTRVELESLYSQRECWLNYVKGENWQEFLSLIDRYQYRREWNNEIEESIKHALKQARSTGGEK